MSTSQPTTYKWIQSLLEPGALLSAAISSYVKVSLEAVFLRGQILAPLLQSERLRSEAFARFWIQFTVPQVEAANQTAQQPSQAPTTPQVSGDLIPPLLARATGTVLDIGPGSGVQMPFLRPEAITAVYGAEPCLGLHAELRASAQKAGLESRYHILPSSVAVGELLPALQKQGVVSNDTNSLDQVRAQGGIFDTIICVRVLCSVPDQEKTIGDLYAMLKPGGKVLVTEHVVNPWRTAKGSVVARSMQSLYHLFGWSWFLGECCLTRDTTEVLRRAADADGGWESAELEPSFGWAPLTYISGVLTKKSA